MFSIHLNDPEEEIDLKWADEMDIGMVKPFLLLYVDDIVRFAHSTDEFKILIETLQNYCMFET